MHITPALIWYKAHVVWLRLQNVQLVAGFCLLTGEDGGFHHRPHVDELWPLDPALQI
jgi:hypothetical protein